MNFVKLGAACCLALFLVACGESPAPKPEANKTDTPVVVPAQQDGTKSEPAQPAPAQ